MDPGEKEYVMDDVNGWMGDRVGVIDVYGISDENKNGKRRLGVCSSVSIRVSVSDT